MNRRDTRMLRRIWLTASVLCIAAPALALAEETPAVALLRTGDVAIGDAKGARKLAFSWSPMLGFFGDHLRLGVGARIGAYAIRPRVSFTNQDATLNPSDFQAITLNSFAHARIRLVGPLEVGANIDVFGYGFGSTVLANYQFPDSSFRAWQPARVSHLNLLELGSGDRGQLDSEFFVAYRFGRVGIRAGVTHFAVELMTKRPVDLGRDRFRHAFTGGFAALSYWY